MKTIFNSNERKVCILKATLIGIVVLLSYVIIPQLYWIKGGDLEISSDYSFLLLGSLLILFLYLIPAVISYLLILFLIVKKNNKGKQNKKSTFLALGNFFGGLVFIYATILGELFWPVEYSYVGGQEGLELLIYPFLIIIYQIIGLVVGAILGVVYTNILRDKALDFKKSITVMFALFVFAIIIMLLFNKRQTNKLNKQLEAKVVIESNQIQKIETKKKLNLNYHFRTPTDSLREVYLASWDSNHRQIVVENTITNSKKVLVKDAFSNRPTKQIVYWKKEPTFIHLDNDHFIFMDLNGNNLYKSNPIKDFYGSIQRAEIVTDKYSNNFLVVLIHRNYRDQDQSLILVFNEQNEIMRIKS